MVLDAPARQHAFETLFSPLRLGPLRLKNRIVAVPHGTAMTERGVPTDDDISFWEARAAGGVAAMITGATTTHPSGVLRDRRRAEPWNPDSLAQMARRADRVHRHGAAILCQLNHLGREGVGGASEYAPVAPSAIRSPRDASTPHPLTAAEIEELIEAFVSGAVNVREAGYDGIELHAAHGYLIAQFLSPASNRRGDEYGGEESGRMRFLERIIAGIRERCDAECVLGVRLSADEEIPEGMHVDDAISIAHRLSDLGGVDYLSLTVGQRGAADLVGMARQLIVDPQWPAKARRGITRSIRPCIGLNQECRTFPGGILCAASARAGRERWFDERLRAPRRHALRVAVVGGGPAGLEAARFAAELGARVALYEREDQLGGQLRLAAAVSSRAGVFALAAHLEHEARRLGVEIRTGVEIDARRFGDVSAGADAVILATGARPLPPSLESDAGAKLITVWDVLRGARPDGERAVVADDGTGFWEAVSAAELLGDAGLSVALVTPARSVGAAIPFESIGPLLRRLVQRGVALHPLVHVTGIREGRVTLVHALTGEPLELPADLVAVHAGTISDDGLAALPADGGAIVRTIGDCVSPRRLTHANWDADRTVLEPMRADSQPRPTPRAW